MDSQPELVAQHYTEAGLVEKSVAYWGKAGRRSAARSAMPEAAAQLDKGLDQLALLLDGRHYLQLVEADVPALVRRHAAPWSRKISATSNAGRGTAAGGYAGGGSFRLFLGFLRGCHNRSSGLSTPAIMPVATRV
jgi:hypothetical protein